MLVSIKNKQEKPQNPSCPKRRENFDVMIYTSDLYSMTQEAENIIIWLQLIVMILNCFSWAIMM